MPILLALVEVDFVCRVGPFQDIQVAQPGFAPDFIGEWVYPKTVEEQSQIFIRGERRRITPYQLYVFARRPIEGDAAYVDGAFELRMKSGRFRELSGDEIARVCGADGLAEEWSVAFAEYRDARDAFEAARQWEGKPGRSIIDPEYLPIEDAPSCRVYLRALHGLRALLRIEDRIVEAWKQSFGNWDWRSGHREFIESHWYAGHAELNEAFEDAKARLNLARRVPLDGAKRARSAAAGAEVEREIAEIARACGLYAPEPEPEPDEFMTRRYQTELRRPGILQYCLERGRETAPEGLLGYVPFLDGEASRKLAEGSGIPLLEADSWRRGMENFWRTRHAAEEWGHLDYLRAMECAMLRTDWLTDSIHLKSRMRGYETDEGIPILDPAGGHPANLARYRELPARIIASIVVHIMRRDAAKTTAQLRAAGPLPASPPLPPYAPPRNSTSPRSETWIERTWPGKARKAMRLIDETAQGMRRFTRAKLVEALDASDAVAMDWDSQAKRFLKAAVERKIAKVVSQEGRAPVYAYQGERSD